MDTVENVDFDNIFPAEVAMYLAGKTVPHFVSPMIAEALGHSEIWATRAMRKVELAAQRDPQLAKQLVVLEGQLRSAQHCSITHFVAEVYLVAEINYNSLP